MRKRLAKFLLPELNRVFWVRLALVAGTTWVACRFVCIPTRIRGASMEPTYHDGGFNFCWRLRYRFRPPRSGEIVVVRLTGMRAMLLKRVVAEAGERVEFRDGQLHVNGQARAEPYVVLPCDWDLPPRTVEPGCVYVVGDNRSVPMECHQFGQVSLARIVGGVVW